MTISESDRLEMHLKLKSVLGDDVANTVMEHLPPSGWGDVARKSDLDHVVAMMNARFDAVHERFTSIDARFTSVDARFDMMQSQIDGLRHAMWALAAITTSGFFGMFALIVTKL